MKQVLTGVVEGLNTRNDGSVVVKFATQEMDSTTAGNLFQFRNKFCKVLISDSNISPLEEGLIDQEKMNGGKKPKTPSQRLRNVIYRVWENQKIPIEFDAFYNQELERLIEEYKTVLNEL